MQLDHKLTIGKFMSRNIYDIVKALDCRFSGTSAKGFFHHYQEHQRPHSILRSYNEGKQYDHAELQHVLSAIMSM